MRPLLLTWEPPTAQGVAMRTTITLDTELLQLAQELTGVTEKTALVRAGLQALIQRESAHRLARLGGSQADLESIARRRSE